MEELHNYIFTYNSYTKNWRVTQRENYLDFFSKPETEFLRSKDINTLMELIIKTSGDEVKIKKLIK